MPKIGEVITPKDDVLRKPDVRLAITTHSGAVSPEQIARGLNGADSPDVRLALGGGMPMSGEALTTPPSPSIKLAHSPGAQGDNVLIGQRGVEAMPDQSRPALLVSFYYLKQFLDNRHRYKFRDWVLDSGAFSAHNSGKAIDLQEYIACCKQLIQTDPELTEIFALDVIGDWRASLKNTEKMWAEGLRVIPCYHWGEPWDVLVGIAKDYPKIALGGVALKVAAKKLPWAQQCFARVWPKKIHGFAFCFEKALMTLPFSSVDATSWEVGPVKFGQWRAFGGQRVSVRGSKQNLRAEVEWYLDLERRVRVRWKKQMEELEQLSPTQPLYRGAPVVRLAIDAGSGGGKRAGEALAPPELRLALGSAGSGTCYQPGGAISRALDPNERLGPSVRLVANGNAGREDVKAEALGPTERLAAGNKDGASSRGPQALQTPVVRLVGANDSGLAGANSIARATNSDEAAEDESGQRKIAYREKPQAGRLTKKKGE